MINYNLYICKISNIYTVGMTFSHEEEITHLTLVTPLKVKYLPIELLPKSY